MLQNPFIHSFLFKYERVRIQMSLHYFLSVNKYFQEYLPKTNNDEEILCK